MKWSEWQSTNWVDARVIVGEATAIDECPTCRFDSRVTFPLYVLTTEGVAPLGVTHACLRCREEGE